MEIIKEYIGPIIFIGIYFLIYVVQKLPKAGEEKPESSGYGESRGDSDFEAARRMVEEKRQQARRQGRQGGYSSRSGEGEAQSKGAAAQSGCRRVHAAAPEPYVRP